MDEQTLVQTTAPDPLRLSTIHLLQRMRKRLGGVAGRSYTRGKRVISQNIPIPTRYAITDIALHPTKIIQRNHTIEELNHIVGQSNEVLASASTFLMLFPDTIVLDRTKLTVRRRRIMSEDVMSIRVEDILNVSVGTGILFGTLTIATRVMSTDDHFRIGQLWRSDAIHLKHMIQGYVIAKHNNINFEQLSLSELITALTELGHDKNF